ncbi:MAG: DNA topoisomerase I [Thermoplasmata archaeon]|nr:MAG: DNA topoisomerase I [Thermoplasmata archaeon]
MKTLVICEKNIAAKRIAQIISNGRYKQSRLYGVPYYTFNDGEWHVIGLRGHILKLDYPAEYNKWEGISPIKLVDIRPMKKIENRNIVQAIKKLAEGVERVIVATDYDREGELIGVEVLEIIPQPHEVKRARFSSLTPYEIKKAFENLVDVDYNLSQSAEARQIIDLVWGATLTRFISLSSGKVGKDFLSVGRVQSPTLALIVEREKQRDSFVPTPYWQIKATLRSDDILFSAIHEKGKLWDEDEAKKIYDAIKDAKKGVIKEFVKERKEEAPPTPFNTTSFLNEASKLGYTAASAMKIAEDLYTRGMISYPRTDNTVYPPGLPIKSIVKKLEYVFPKEVKEVITNGREKPMRGKTIAHDHPPIHPVELVEKEKLEKREWKIYELIVRRFLATLAKNAIVEITNADIEIDNQVFKAEGYKIVEANWKNIYPYVRMREREIGGKKGEEVEVVDVKKVRDETKPPKRYTQGSLILQMESYNLGTKSTRHEIIEKLYKRNYIKGKTIVPTLSGIAVTEALQKGAEIITKPDMTADLEKKMNEIAEGKVSLQEVVEESRVMLKKVLEMLERRKEHIGDVLREAISKQNFFGKCPQCGGNLSIMKSRKGKRFLGCSNFPRCNNSYSLPQKGSISFDGEYCNICGAPMVTITYKGKWKQCVNLKCPSKNN